MEKRIGNYLIEVKQDMSPESPRSWDNLGTMVCFHNRYSLGDKHNYNSNDYSGWDEQLKVISKNEDVCVILPIFMYEHSGVCINTKPYSCPWDSGQIGHIFVSKEKVRKEYNVKRISKKLKECITKYLEGEVKTYSDYLEGNVYSYEINKITICNEGCEHKHFMDSCSGFIGDEDYCLEEAERVVQHYINSEKLVLEEQIN
jgi:hypothetical protein